MGHTVSLFGKTYKYTDYPVLQLEIENVREQYEGKTDDEIKVIIQKTKMYEDMQANCISNSELVSKIDKDGNDISSLIGNNFLVINNTKRSAYTFTSSSYSLNAENYYRVSVWVRTYKVNGAGASIEFFLGSANEKDTPFIFSGIGTKEGENGCVRFRLLFIYTYPFSTRTTAKYTPSIRRTFALISSSSW